MGWVQLNRIEFDSFCFLYGMLAHQCQSACVSIHTHILFLLQVLQQVSIILKQLI